MHRAPHSKLANPIRATGTSQFRLSLTAQGLEPILEAFSQRAEATVKETKENANPRAFGTPRAVTVTLQSPTANPAARVTEVDGGHDKMSSAVADHAPNLGQFTVEPSPQKASARRSLLTKVEPIREGRRSIALRLAEVRNIKAAAVFTAEEHWPLNRHTTIHFEAAGIADPVTALRRYTKLARDWLRTQGATFAYIWVREAGDLKGEHAHILMHVPSRLIKAFARRERGWRKRIGAKRALGAFHSTPVGRSYRHAEVGIQYGESYSCHLAEIVAYLVKGAEPHVRKALGLALIESGGELWGKRTGMSENIGRAARRRTE